MWLLSQEAVAEIRLAVEAGFVVSAEQQAKFEAEAEAREAGILRHGGSGGTAQIRVEGVLTPRPNLLLMLLGAGNTTYAGIQRALATAAADPNVADAEMHFDTPGGHIDGLFETIAAIQAFPKPLRMKASKAASAGYALAAAKPGVKIEASSVASLFGSIGVMTELAIDSKTVKVTSTNAPDKNPDPSTPEGLAAVRKHLDAVHALFAEAIAVGRETTVERVNAEFGRGGTFLAEEAERRGMIDSVRRPALRAVPTPRAATAAEATTPEPAPGSTSTPVVKATPAKASKMTKEELKAAHPELHAALIKEGSDAGEKKGAEAALKTERDRVEAFLVAGENSGDMKGAIEGIRAGAEMTMASMTKFMFASRNKGDVDARQAESDAANKVLEGSPEAASQDIETQTAALVEKRFGKK